MSFSRRTNLCSITVKLLGLIDPREECNTWKVLKCSCFQNFIRPLLQFGENWCYPTVRGHTYFHSILTSSCPVLWHLWGASLLGADQFMSRHSRACPSLPATLSLYWLLSRNCWRGLSIIIVHCPPVHCACLCYTEYMTGNTDRVCSPPGMERSLRYSDFLLGDRTKQICGWPSSSVIVTWFI